MPYEVRCECGKALVVSSADAGSSVRCACGRIVEVPALHDLRADAGEDVLSPAARIEALLTEGRLPGTRECAVCARGTDVLALVAVDCERGRMATPDGSESRHQVAAGCLFGLLVGGAKGLAGANRIMNSGESEAPRQVGQDIAYELPLPMCVMCRSEVLDSNRLLQALCRVPDYAALLDQYPDAKVLLLSKSKRSDFPQ